MRRLAVLLTLSLLAGCAGNAEATDRPTVRLAVTEMKGIEQLQREFAAFETALEEYADRAWMVALAGFAVSFATTRSVQRAVAAKRS